MNFSYLRREPGFYRRVFTLALPVVLQNLITTSLGFMDTFMVGLVGQEQMSAVTVANVPIYIIQLIVFGLQSGSRVLISQFWGREIGNPSTGSWASASLWQEAFPPSAL